MGRSIGSEIGGDFGRWHLRDRPLHGRSQRRSILAPSSREPEYERSYVGTSRRFGQLWWSHLLSDLPLHRARLPPWYLDHRSFLLRHWSSHLLDQADSEKTARGWRLHVSVNRRNAGFRRFEGAWTVHWFDRVFCDMHRCFVDLVSFVHMFRDSARMRIRTERGGSILELAKTKGFVW